MGAMKKGIAVEFSNRYPNMYEAYRVMCREKRIKPGDAWFYKTQDRIIANLATQNRPGPDARYAWITESLEKALERMEYNGIDRISIPRLGCGIGGLSWDQVYYNLVSNFEESPITIEVWSLSV
jgi:O-acetyl-ADP-ribose deacetylase (regulator of RNase III)